MSDLTVDTVIKTYIALRDKKEAIENEAKERARECLDQMLKIEAWLKQQASEMGVTSFKTQAGTAFVTTTDFASVADWDAMLEFVKTNEAFDMFERRVSKRAVRSYIDSTGSVPPGVNYGTKLELNVRRPSPKID